MRRCRCRYLPLVLMLSLVPLTCTPLVGPPATPLQHQALISLAVSLGTSAFLQDHPTLSSLVWRVAHDAAQATAGTLDVTQLAPTLATVIDRTALSPPDRGLLRELVGVVLAEVQAYLDRAHLQPTQVQVVASDVFAAMERAALARLGGVVPGTGS